MIRRTTGQEFHLRRPFFFSGWSENRAGSQRLRGGLSPVDKPVRYGNRTGSSCGQPLKNPVARETGLTGERKTGFSGEATGTHRANIAKKGLTHPCLAASFLSLLRASRVNRPSFIPLYHTTNTASSFCENV